MADIEESGMLEVALGTKGGTVYEGFEKDKCILTKQSDGYYKISFKDQSILDLRTKPVSLHINFKNAKLYAIKGSLECNMLKY